MCLASSEGTSSHQQWTCYTYDNHIADAETDSVELQVSEFLRPIEQVLNHDMILTIIYKQCGPLKKVT
ncbi:hypothetical protein L1987_14019 [Smallanthus sonchifolius]|uniref:Uncharacterized protein n=1 Tax=Smallanthus sonchifolius TaxID=185202 RepID=A0ACB9JJ28_9ASTR|nr:hypothetical protein L1987_14019 [Smallanthus sonchifolius]